MSKFKLGGNLLVAGAVLIAALVAVPWSSRWQKAVKGQVA
jgi:hypothetical protein